MQLFYALMTGCWCKFQGKYYNEIMDEGWWKANLA